MKEKLKLLVIVNLPDMQVAFLCMIKKELILSGKPCFTINPKWIRYTRILKLVYANLQSSGKVDVIDHLFIDRIDICPFGNTKPFRIRIVNSINDNFDYFYVKRADASRIYGLELEHLLSPNRINYIVHNETLVEEHIIGIPGDQFIKHHLEDKQLNKVRFAKEFVKFNKRTFSRLLGDMHSSNFVIDITPDFEEVHYRIRAIDFDQQSFEGRKAVYNAQVFQAE